MTPLTSINLAAFVSTSAGSTVICASLGSIIPILGTFIAAYGCAAGIMLVTLII